MDIEAIKARCPEIMEGEDCYRVFRSAGLEYGPGFRVVERIYRNEQEALSRWVLPEAYEEGLRMFVLHPSIMDGALQTVLGVMGTERNRSGTAHLPYTMGEVIWLRPLGRQGYARAIPTGSPGAGELAFDIDLLDDAGKAAVRIKAFTLRAMEQTPDTPVKKYFQWRWEKAEIRFRQPETKSRVLIFDTREDRRDTLSKRLNTKVVLVRPDDRFRCLNESTYPESPRDTKK